MWPAHANLDANVVDGAKRTGRGRGCTLFMTLLAGYVTLCIG